MSRELTLWKAYATITTLALAAIAVAAFRPAAAPASFGTISVQRINVVGPDGALQMAISNRQAMPEGRMDGKTFTSQGRHDGAGLIFYNALGDEDGGLTFGGNKTSKGYAADAGLMFDQFKQDQTVGLVYNDANGRRTAGLRVWQRPDLDLATEVESIQKMRALPAGAAKAAAEAKFQRAAAAGNYGALRLFAGKAPDGTSQVVLNDAAGHARLRLEVTAAGEPSIAFLDAAGKVVRRLP
ncbi:MAG: hypothetical protein ACRD01_08380 [Terriglobales bacterium]